MGIVVELLFLKSSLNFKYLRSIFVFLYINLSHCSLRFSSTGKLNRLILSIRLVLSGVVLKYVEGNCTLLDNTHLKFNRMGLRCSTTFRQSAILFSLSSMLYNSSVADTYRVIKIARRFGPCT